MVVDLGTGDGRAVLARARSSSGELVIGIDASAAAMRVASQRAAARPSRGGVPHAWFLVAAAETLPGALAGTADLVTVTLPWGSLLRGVLGRDDPALCGLAGLLKPGGRLEAFVSVTPRDRVDGFETLSSGAADGIAGAWAAAGLCLASMRPATLDELRATGSTWAKRLGPRPVWRLVGQR